MGLFDGIFKKMKGYNNYTKEDFATEDEDSLIDSAKIWVSFQIDNWEEELEIVMEFEEPLRIVYACTAVFDEVMNGGFNQFFFNSSARWITVALKGFQALGLQELYDGLETAIEIYSENSSLLDAYNDGTIESFSKSYELHIFDEVDALYSEQQDHYSDCLTKFIKENIHYFGN